jgi:hypothetical protein
MEGNNGSDISQPLGPIRFKAQDFTFSSKEELKILAWYRAC